MQAQQSFISHCIWQAAVQIPDRQLWRKGFFQKVKSPKTALLWHERALEKNIHILSKSRANKRFGCELRNKTTSQTQYQPFDAWLLSP